MFNFLRKLFEDDNAGAPSGRVSEKLMHVAIEHVIDATDPRLRLVSNYARKLTPAVETAVLHVMGIAERLPPARRLDRASFVTDTWVNALFGSADSMQRIVSLDPQVLAFRERPEAAGLTQFYGMLACRRDERRVLAPARQGEVIHQDVPRTQISFSEHALHELQPVERDAYRGIMRRGYDFLAGCALERIANLRDQRETLSERYRLHLGKLQALRRGGHGIGVLDRNEPDAATLAAAEADLARIERELEDATTSLQTLDDYLEQVAHVLSHPADHLWDSSAERRLDRLGVLVEDPTQPGSTILFNEVSAAEDQRVTFGLVCVPVDELLARPQLPPDAVF